MLSAAQLLDELMGRDRNLAPDEKRSNVRWDHETVSEAPNLLANLSGCWEWHPPCAYVQAMKLAIKAVTPYIVFGEGCTKGKIIETTICSYQCFCLRVVFLNGLQLAATLL